jgi:hypothetical protein
MLAASTARAILIFIWKLLLVNGLLT